MSFFNQSIFCPTLSMMAILSFNGLNGSGAKKMNPTTITENIKASFSFNSSKFLINDKNWEIQIN